MPQQSIQLTLNPFNEEPKVEPEAQEEVEPVLVESVFIVILLLLLKQPHLFM